MRNYCEAKMSDRDISDTDKMTEKDEGFTSPPISMNGAQQIVNICAVFAHFRHFAGELCTARTANRSYSSNSLAKEK